MTVPVRHRRIALLLVVAAITAGVVALLSSGGGGPGRFAPGLGRSDGTSDPLAYDSGDRAGFEQRAGQGLSHVLYAKSPGGAVATAQRVSALRPLILDVARRAHQDPATLEAIVFLESAGRPDVAASGDLHSAVGLTQILAQTATGLLGLKVDVARSESLTHALAHERSPRRAARLRARLRVVDERFDPRKALEATTRYLAFAQQQLGRDDLAIVSYHMGVGNLQQALKRYGDEDAAYTQLFFDSSPRHHAPAWRLLAALGDDSSTYLWRIRAAQQIMALWRKDPVSLRHQAALQAGPSGEHVLRPPASTPAARRQDLVPLDAGVLRRGQSRLSTALAGAPAQQRALRPGAAALLRYLAAGVAEIAPGTPLVITAAARTAGDEATAGEGGVGVEAAPSEHTTGYAFDVSRDYASPAQAQAFQFWLDRLQALDVIAWTREPHAIHITVGPRAHELLR